MKKAWLSLLAIPVVAYPAAAWYMGSQVVGAMDSQYQDMPAQPYVQIMDRKVDQGIFSSEETVSLGFGPSPKTPALIIRSSIHHGPFTGGQLAAATVDSQLELTGPAKAELAKLFGDKSPLSAQTLINFDGSGTSHVSSPAFGPTTLPGAGGMETHMSWDGLQADMSFTANSASYTLQGALPRLEIEGEGGLHIRFRDMQFDLSQERPFTDEPLLYTGKQRLTLANFKVKLPIPGKPPVILDKLEYSAETPINGDFMDVLVRMGAQGLNLDGTDYGPVHYDVSLRHLHARTYAKFYGALMQGYKDILSGKGNKEALEEGAPGFDSKQLMSSISGPAMELLGHAPEYSLDRISFTLPEGEAMLSLRASVPGVTAEDLQNPMMLITKLKADGKVSFPEALIQKLAPSCPAPSDVDATEMPAMPMGEESENCVSQDDESPAARNLQRLETLVEMGYVTRDQGRLQTEASFKEGQLTLNGLPFNPMAMSQE